MFCDPNTGASLRASRPTTGDRLVCDPTPRRHCHAGTRSRRPARDDFHCFTTADRFNFAPFNLLLTPSERKGVFGQVRLRHHRQRRSCYAKVLFNNRESTNQAAPEPIFLGPDAGAGDLWPTTSSISARQSVQPVRLRPARSPASNFVPDRPPSDRRRSAHLRAGSRHAVLQRPAWTATFDVGERSCSLGRQLRRTARTRPSRPTSAATTSATSSIALGDPAVLRGDAGLRAAQPLRRSRHDHAGDAGLHPADRARPQREQSLSLFSANLTGDLFDMPAGALAFAAGYEYRKYEGLLPPRSARPWPASTTACRRCRPSGELRRQRSLSSSCNVPLLPTALRQAARPQPGRRAIPTTRPSAASSRPSSASAGRWSMTCCCAAPTPKASARRRSASSSARPQRFDAAAGRSLRRSAAGSPPTGDRRQLRRARRAGRLRRRPTRRSRSSPAATRTCEPETRAQLHRRLVFSPAFGRQHGVVGAGSTSRCTFYHHEIEGAIQALDAQTQLNLCVQTLDPRTATASPAPPPA